MKGSGFFDMEDKTLIISCAGNLTVRGDVGSSVRFVTDGATGDSFDGATGRFVSQSNAALRVPHYVSVIVESVGGNAQFKGLDGSLTVDSAVGGNLTISTVNGGVNLHGVGGNAVIKHCSGALTNKGWIGGDLNVKHSADITMLQIGGNANIKHINGDTAIETVSGNLSARHINGDIHIDTVEGDTSISHLGGLVNITSMDDVRIAGPLTSGKHTVVAKSRIDFYYRGSEPLTVSAEAPNIVNKIVFDKVIEEGGKLFGTVGEHEGATVALTAGDRITMRSSGAPGDSYVEFEAEFDEMFDFSDLNALGEQISAEVNARMEELSSKLTPEVNQYAERAIRRAKEAVDRVVERMESELARAEHEAQRDVENATRRYRPPTPPTPPAPPKGAPMPPAPPKPDNSAAQLKVLKMLEDGKISVEQANELLAALE